MVTLSACQIRFKSFFDVVYPVGVTTN